MPLNVNEHPRQSELGQWVYPVKSRRAGGLSLGLNVNSDQRCSFDCVYCQVRREGTEAHPNPSVESILAEVHSFLQSYQKNGNWQGMTLQDISIAGDGEPTLYKELPQLLGALLDLRIQLDLPVRLVLFTNATQLDRADLDPLWPRFFAEGGEVWAKLDSWDQASFWRLHGKAAHQQKVINHLLTLGRQYPLVIQSCFFRPSADEEFDENWLDSWVSQMNWLVEQGLKVAKIQAYTLARPTKEQGLVPYDDDDMRHIGDQIRAETGQPVEVYFSK
ncbi:MAG: radical SAM protein [bacterium]|nr:radical SAM protein [bacterium]